MTDSKPTVWEIVRRHARVQNVDAFAVLAAVEAALEVLQQREGSTPIASPARPCGMHYSWQSDGVRLAGTLGPCVLDVGHYVAPHRDEHGNEWSSQGLLVIDPQPADEPAPVPPPVDALERDDDLTGASARTAKPVPPQSAEPIGWTTMLKSWARWPNV